MNNALSSKIFGILTGSVFDIALIVDTSSAMICCCVLAMVFRQWNVVSTLETCIECT